MRVEEDLVELAVDEIGTWWLWKMGCNNSCFVPTGRIILVAGCGEVACDGGVCVAVVTADPRRVRVKPESVVVFPRPSTQGRIPKKPSIWGA